MRKIVLPLFVLALCACHQQAPETVSQAPEKEEIKDTVIIRDMPVDTSKISAVSGTGKSVFIHRYIQDFQVSSKRDTFIKTNGGIVIYIPSNAFNTDNASVNISLQEYNSKADIVLAGLATSTQEDLLETNGIINIKATAGGNEVDLKPNKKMIVEFPKVVKGKGMELYYGSEKGSRIVWEKDTVFRFIDKTFLTVGSSNAGGDSVKQVFSGAMFQDTSKYKYAAAYIQDKLAYEDRFESYLLNNKLVVSFKINAKGKAEDVRFDKPGVPAPNAKTAKAPAKKAPAKAPVNLSKDQLIGQEFESRVIAMIKGMPPLKPGAAGSREQMPFSLSKKQVARYTQNKEFVGSFEKKYAKGRTLKQEEQNYYIFPMSGFGWYTCDRMPNIKAPKTNFMVTVDGPYKTDVRLIASDFKSINDNVIKEGSNYWFNNVPKELKIKILVVQYRNDQTYYAIKESNTSMLEEEGFSFKPIGEEEIKQKLQVLN